MLPKAPTGHNHLHLDTRYRMFATSDTGAPIRGENGDPMPIAQDLVSGNWYAKVALHMPWRKTNEDAERLKILLEQNAVHIADDNEHFRGVWVPMPMADAKTKRSAVEVDAQTELPAGHEAPRLLPGSSPPMTDARRPGTKAAKKTAVKKAAAKSPQKPN